MAKQKGRQVSLSTLDDVLDHVRELQLDGYVACGKWNLGQMCNHLAQAIDLTLELNVPRFVESAGVGLLMNSLWIGRIGAPLGLRLPTSLPQKKPVHDGAGIERLADAVTQLKTSGRENLVRFHLWHCNHHLGFLLPRKSSSGSS